jgi:hypothetical protein
MKHNNIHASITNIAIITVALILMYQNTNAQPGYPPPWVHMAPYWPVYVPYSRPQSVPQGYNPWSHPAGPPTFIRFSMHFDPLISWFSTYSYDVHSNGAIPGFNFGISYNKYFGPNYSFSSGISIINAGGRLISNETTYFELKNYNNEITIVQPGEPIIYKYTISPYLWG